MLFYNMYRIFEGHGAERLKKCRIKINSEVSYTVTILKNLLFTMWSLKRSHLAYIL